MKRIRATQEQIEAARAIYQDDDCEIDDDALQSRADEESGQWVSAWVWVSDVYIKPKYFDCGGCGHYHPFGWTGDCRDDSQRFTGEELEKKHGEIGEDWLEVDEVTGLELVEA